MQNRADIVITTKDKQAVIDIFKKLEYLSLHSFSKVWDILGSDQTLEEKKHLLARHGSIVTKLNDQVNVLLTKQIKLINESDSPINGINLPIKFKKILYGRGAKVFQVTQEEFDTLNYKHDSVGTYAEYAQGLYAKLSARYMSATTKSGVFVSVKGTGQLYYLNPSDRETPYVSIITKEEFKSYANSNPSVFYMDDNQLDEYIGFDKLSTVVNRKISWSKLYSNTNHNLVYGVLESLLFKNQFVSFITDTYSSILTNIENLLILFIVRNESDLSGEKMKAAALFNLILVVLKAAIVVGVAFALMALFASNPVGLSFMAALGLSFFAILAAEIVRSFFLDRGTTPLCLTTLEGLTDSVVMSDKAHKLLAIDIERTIAPSSGRSCFGLFPDSRITQIYQTVNPAPGTQILNQGAG
ncbi:MAG: hypothetical protein Q8R83_00185 [Legionellaceae bacterium]|nr:hypothetical protein [Legionellaceae bacterium]